LFFTLYNIVYLIICINEAIDYLYQFIQIHERPIPIGVSGY